MVYRLAADAVLLLHLLFILFAVLGALLALRWRAVLWLQVPAFLWAGYVMASGRICPLTPLENALRHKAGEVGYQGGFVEHYITALIYPDGLTRALQLGLALGVVLINFALYAWLWAQMGQQRRAHGS
jgi:Protein of Unknown function (DUF2784)